MGVEGCFYVITFLTATSYSWTILSRSHSVNGLFWWFACETENSRSELTSIDEWMHGRISYSNASFSVLVVFYLRWFILAIVLLLCVSMGLLTCDSYLVPVDWYCSPALAHRLIEPIYRPTYLITTCISLWSAFIALGLIWSLYVELCLLTHSSSELFPVSQASLQIILWKWHTF